MMLVGAEKLSPSTVFLEKEKYFIKTLLAIVYVMLGDRIVRVIDHRMHYLKKKQLFSPNEQYTCYVHVSGF